MKQFLLSILCFLMLTSISSSRMTMMIVGGGAPDAAGGACGSWASGNGTHEDFDGADDLTWADDTAGSGTITDNETTVGTGVCGFDTAWLKVLLGTGSWGNAFTETNYGSALTTAYIRFVMYVESHTLADQYNMHVFGMNSSAGADSQLAVRMQNDSGQLVLHMQSGGYSQDSTNISIQTGYCVEVKVINEGGGGDEVEWRVTAEVDGTYGAPASEGTTDDDDMSPQYFKFGQEEGESTNNPHVIVFDNFDISTSGWLGCDDA